MCVWHTRGHTSGESRAERDGHKKRETEKRNWLLHRSSPPLLSSLPLHCPGTHARLSSLTHSLAVMLVVRPTLAPSRSRPALAVARTVRPRVRIAPAPRAGEGGSSSSPPTPPPKLLTEAEQKAKAAMIESKKNRKREGESTREGEGARASE